METSSAGLNAAPPAVLPTIAPRILLAEDDEAMRALMLRALRAAHYRVVPCPDGWRLLQYVTPYLLAAHVRPAEHFDLVISDVRMPVLTGLEVLDGGRSVEGFPPFILITAFGDEELRRHAERSGAVAWFEKPFDIDSLLTDVRRIVPPAAS